ncbi:multiprotein-bridging factor 1c [Corchorus olitorius]|uniref:Multiprotein-bridging factor 1c n=1 Tax=Corchorus olitorius TaxID=93759 RepID=A0A1R3L407_9ROSI|nr:multiprotein-bridging factor 1c [Corchorus olitorius]
MLHKSEPKAQELCDPKTVNQALRTWAPKGVAGEEDEFGKSKLNEEDYRLLRFLWGMVFVSLSARESGFGGLILNWVQELMSIQLAAVEQRFVSCVKFLMKNGFRGALEMVLLLNMNQGGLMDLWNGINDLKKLFDFPWIFGWNFIAVMSLDERLFVAANYRLKAELLE